MHLLYMPNLHRCQNFLAAGFKQSYKLHFPTFSQQSFYSKDPYCRKRVKSDFNASSPLFNTVFVTRLPQGTARLSP